MTANDEQGPAFGTFRLAGGRYERPGLPVSTAVELHRYERLVVAVARALYFRDHDKRKRSPRGFDTALDLRITGIEPGSVMPTIERGRAETELVLVVGDDYFDRARRAVNDALGSINGGGGLPRTFPVEALPEFSVLGRGLADAERIELSGDSEPVVEVTQQTRRTIRALASSDDIEVERTVQGQVTGLRSSPQQFDLQMSENRRVEGTYLDPDIWKDLHEFEGYRHRAAFVSLSVVARQTLNGELLAITDVLGIEAALPPEWADRIDELAKLRVGWLLDDTEPPTREALDFAEEFLLACVDDAVTRPAIYPSTAGGVQLEWKLPHRAIEVEIANDPAVRFFGLDLEGEDDVEWTIGRDIDELLDLVREHV